jgi:mannose-6-phosphate isomerase
MSTTTFKLTGKIQHYLWGGYYFIPQLIGIENKTGHPYAELWLGAHPGTSSMIEVNGCKASLHDLIEQQPAQYLGESVYEKFGELPYLFKVLDVKEMLSIQVHPTKEAASICYEAEEAAGISLNAPHRNYKDKNHKPEVMVALSEFWLLHGFKQGTELKKTLASVPELSFLLPVLETGGYKALYKEVMEMPQQKVNNVLLSLVKNELNKKQTIKKEEPGYWVNKLYSNDEEIKDIDRGIFSIYFFNIVKLMPGEGIFQGAGIPHAYLEGQNIELMANSDNVLRGGLTLKHIDVPELLKHTIFDGVTPQVLKGEKISRTENFYPCPVDDFGLSRIELSQGESYLNKTHSGEIFLLLKGSVNTEDAKPFHKGEAIFILPGTEYKFIATENTIIYKAFVPLN